jgi:hypothetical protein
MELILIHLPHCNTSVPEIISGQCFTVFILRAEGRVSVVFLDWLLALIQKLSPLLSVLLSPIFLNFNETKLGARGSVLG